MNEIVALAIHKLDPVDGTYNIRLADKQLSVTATTQRVIDELHDLHNGLGGREWNEMPVELAA